MIILAQQVKNLAAKQAGVPIITEEEYLQLYIQS